MIKLNNLTGTIMLGDTSLVHFQFSKDVLVNAELLCHDVAKLPIEFKKGIVNDRLIRCFFEERITPDTRQGLQEKLHENGMEYYDPETLIRFQHGRCIADKYWLKTE